LAPSPAFDSNGQPIDLPAGFAATIGNLRHEIGPEKALVFNLVHNWPVDRIASTSLDFWYSELWPPDTSLARLWRTMRANRGLNPRPAVLAVYIPPEHETTIIAAQSTILAAGGAHIAHGEHVSYLSDPYFPKARKPGPELASRLGQLADFAVAYEETLVFAEDVSDDWAGHILLNGTAPEPGSLIVRQAGHTLYMNLLRNGGAWDTALEPRRPLAGLRLTVPAGLKGLTRAWCAAPESPLPCLLPSFELPLLADWLLVGLEFEDTPSCPT
jgi:hypothetical protein